MLTFAENLFCASTYQKILAHVARAAVEQATIRLSTKVVKILSEEHDEDNGANVIVTTDDGNKHLFDEVVVTAPLGWLQKNKAIFSPILPARFSKAIDSLGYGCLEKVFAMLVSQEHSDVS